MEAKQSKAALISALIYTPLSLAIALAFFIVANSQGKYTVAMTYGGAAWVFLLTMIVTMPTITPWVKKRF